jgi:hypothetical protein
MNCTSIPFSRASPLCVVSDRVAVRLGELGKVEQRDLAPAQVRLHRLRVVEPADTPAHDHAVVAGQNSQDAIGVALDEGGHALTSAPAAYVVNPRPSMVPAMPGWEILAELAREDVGKMPRNAASKRGVQLERNGRPI